LAELARRAKLRRQTVSKVVNGHTQPHRRTLDKISDALGTTTEVLTRPEPGPEADSATDRRDEAEILVEYFEDLDATLREVAMAFVTGLATSGSVEAATHVARAAEAIAQKRAGAATAAARRPRRRAGA